MPVHGEVAATIRLEHGDGPDIVADTVTAGRRREPCAGSHELLEFGRRCSGQRAFPGHRIEDRIATAPEEHRAVGLHPVAGVLLFLRVGQIESQSDCRSAAAGVQRLVPVGSAAATDQP